MEKPRWPTFGEVLSYLRGLGFTVTAAKPGYVRCAHPQEGSWFVFRERPETTPAREIELLDMKVQLTQRGFVTDEEFAAFWDSSASPTNIAPPVPQ